MASNTSSPAASPALSPNSTRHLVVRESWRGSFAQDSWRLKVLGVESSIDLMNIMF